MGINHLLQFKTVSLSPPNPKAFFWQRYSLTLSLSLSLARSPIRPLFYTSRSLVV